MIELQILGKNGLYHGQIMCIECIEQDAIHMHDLFVQGRVGTLSNSSLGQNANTKE
jgi:hypothetical protein